MLDIKYSQNFYTNSKKLHQILENISFSKDDLILDIGAGNGFLTKELAKYSETVIAYELDSKYFQILKRELDQKIDIRNEDFLKAKLPQKSFKVFSNIPFTLTSAVISKLTNYDSFLEEAYLFVQKEAGDRYVGDMINTQIATVLNFKYEVSVVERFDSRDFSPVPNVEIVLLKIKKREGDIFDFNLFRDFVTYIFNQTNARVENTFEKIFTEKQMVYISKELKRNGYVKPSDIDKGYYIEIFKYFKMNGPKYLERVNGFYGKYSSKHFKREKVFRTRI